MKRRNIIFANNNKLTQIMFNLCSIDILFGLRDDGGLTGCAVGAITDSAIVGCGGKSVVTKATLIVFVLFPTVGKARSMTKNVGMYIGAVLTGCAMSLIFRPNFDDSKHSKYIFKKQ